MAGEPKAPRDGVLAGMFDDADTVARLENAADPDAFKLVDEGATDYRCPFCGFCWNGNPRPLLSDDAKEEDNL